MTESENRLARESRAMVETIAVEARETENWTGRRAFAPAVMDAMGRVPRHLFVDPAQRVFAYENRPMTIGYGQTISQPFIVALICELAEVSPGSRVLEVGTGCGYQAAVLAAMDAEVVTIERIPELAEAAAARLKELGYDKVEVHQGDGTRGWPASAPYDAIVVTAAAFEDVPPALVEQLAAGGRLVIPIERPAGWHQRLMGRREQELVLIVKDDQGRVSRHDVLPVAFVPLIPDED